PRVAPPGQRIAVAQDCAFSFLYPHVLDGWRAAGADVRAFSPLADQAPPSDSDVVWLPGGYPELHAGTLASAHRFHAGLRAFAAPGCGPWPRAPFRSMASAVATWCWATGSRMARACVTAWWACSRWRRRLRRADCISATGVRDWPPIARWGPGASRCSAMSSTT